MDSVFVFDAITDIYSILFIGNQLSVHTVRVTDYFTPGKVAKYRHGIYHGLPLIIVNVMRKEKGVCR